MTEDLDDLGPIDYLVVEFPGARLTGEALPLLLDLVDRGIIRILDLVFIRKDLDGSVVMLEIADLDGDGRLDTRFCTVPHPVCSAATTSSKRPPWSNRAARPGS